MRHDDPYVGLGGTSEVFMEGGWVTGILFVTLRTHYLKV